MLDLIRRFQGYTYLHRLRNLCVRTYARHMLCALKVHWISWRHQSGWEYFRTYQDFHFTHFTRTLENVCMNVCIACFDFLLKPGMSMPENQRNEDQSPTQLLPAAQSSFQSPSSTPSKVSLSTKSCLYSPMSQPCAPNSLPAKCPQLANQYIPISSNPGAITIVVDHSGRWGCADGECWWLSW